MKTIKMIQFFICLLSVWVGFNFISGVVFAQYEPRDLYHNYVIEPKMNQTCIDTDTLMYFAEWTSCRNIGDGETPECTEHNHTQFEICSNGCDDSSNTCSPEDYMIWIIFIIIVVAVVIILKFLGG